MVRIVQVNRSDSVRSEFILLQNQGGLRVTTRGLAVVSDRAICEGDMTFAHVFGDDTLVPPGAFVLLHTGQGEASVTRCKDGVVFHAYMNRDEPVWDRATGALHVLAPQHTYVERTQPALVLR